MNKKILKFKLSTINSNDLAINIGGEILSVLYNTRDKCVCLYALVDPKLDKESRLIEVFETGEDIYYDMGFARKFLATCSCEDGYIVHVFERLN